MRKLDTTIDACNRACTCYQGCSVCRKGALRSPTRDMHNIPQDQGGVTRENPMRLSAHAIELEPTTSVDCPLRLVSVFGDFQP